MEKRFVTISRKWNNPQIKSTVTDDGISISIDLEDFLSAILMEMSITEIMFCMTKGGLKRRLKPAIDKVLSGVKKESTKIMAKAAVER